MTPLLALIGWAVAIGVNTLADSLPNRRGPRMPRCHACGAPRPHVAVSALVGLLAGKGSCGYCGSGRGVRAPAVELLAIIGAPALGLLYSEPLRIASALAVSAVFLLIVVTDLEHRLILNAVVLPAALLFAAIGALDPLRGPGKTLLGGLVGFVAFYLLYLLGGLFGRLASSLRGRPLSEVPFGFGDVNLAGLIGLALGWPGVLLGLVLGIFAAGAYSLLLVAWMAARRRYSAFTPFPYGPFLILGALAVYFRVWNVLEA